MVGPPGGFVARSQHPREGGMPRAPNGCGVLELSRAGHPAGRCNREEESSSVTTLEYERKTRCMISGKPTPPALFSAVCPA